MGYSMSRPSLDTYMHHSGQASNGPRLRQGQHEFFSIDDEIAHRTRLMSEPSESVRKAIHGGRKMPISTVRMLSARESNCSGRGRLSSTDCSYVLGQYLPSKGPWPVDRMDSRAYVSQFSADGSVLVAGFQGSHIRIYNVDNGWKVKKDIIARNLRWTVTDTSLSPDQRYLVYSSMSPVINIVNVETAATESHANVNDIHEGLDLSLHEDAVYSFGIFSVKFSTDGREVVAGSSDDSIYVYDLGANKLKSRYPAHMSDVNTVTFADETGNLIYSGSDDNLCKVWDRRCFSTEGQAAGILTGHIDGITFIDSRGDGRYFISNGKDQSIKLWDIRKMWSSIDCSESRAFGGDIHHTKHPHDQSLATFRGHSVLRTLIRCYFSPVYSTGQKYIYTGSHDTYVYIYDLVSGAQVAKLDCHQSTVRDCSWHPYYPMLVSSSWDGLIARWEFPGDGTAPAINKQLRGSIEDRFRDMYLEL